jgi:hypothetical protein
MTKVCYLNTYTTNKNAAFNGTWGVYSYSESENLVSGDSHKDLVIVGDSFLLLLVYYYYLSQL